MSVFEGECTSLRIPFLVSKTRGGDLHPLLISVSRVRMEGCQVGRLDHIVVQRFINGGGRKPAYPFEP